MSLSFHRAGAGAPLVLIHGIGHRWQAWQPVLPLLTEHHDVIAIDLPGFGASPEPEGDVLSDIRLSVRMLAELLAGMGVRQPHVAGYSLGGAMSLEMATAGLCASATAFSPAGFYTEAELRRSVRLLKRLRATTFAPSPLIRTTMASPRLRQRLFRALVAHPERISAQVGYEDALAMRRGRGFRTVANAAHDYRFDGSVSVPTTVAWGELDRILPVSQAVLAQTLLPHARHMVLADCGHVAMSDNPKLVAATILETTGAA